MQQSYVLLLHLQKQTCGCSGVYAGISWGITTHWAAGEIWTTWMCLICFWNIISWAVHSHAVWKGHTCWHILAPKHPNLTLTCNFSIIPQKRRHSHRLFKTHRVVYWYFYSKAALIIHSVPWGTNRGTNKPHYFTFTMPTNSRHVTALLPCNNTKNSRYDNTAIKYPWY